MITTTYRPVVVTATLVISYTLHFSMHTVLHTTSKIRMKLATVHMYVYQVSAKKKYTNIQMEYID